LGKFATVFQTEIYAILQDAYENIRICYKNMWFRILSESEDALKALSRPKVTSKMVAECMDVLSVLACLMLLTSFVCLGTVATLANEESDKLAIQESAKPLLAPEPALGIPKCLTRDVIMNWIWHQHHCTWRDLPGHRYGKFFIGKPCKKRADDLLRLSMHLLRLTVAIFTGHTTVRGHLYTMGLFDGDPTCRFCRKETETVQHIICCCDALAHQR
jgi:hypothetical protein